MAGEDPAAPEGRGVALRELGELGLIERVRRRLGPPGAGVLVGIGDDAAAVADLLAEDAEGNPALVLGAALGGTDPLRDKQAYLLSTEALALPPFTRTTIGKSIHDPSFCALYFCFCDSMRPSV